MHLFKQLLKDLKDMPRLRREIKKIELDLRFSDARIEMLKRFTLVLDILALQQKEIKTLKNQIKQVCESNPVTGGDKSNV